MGTGVMMMDWTDEWEEMRDLNLGGEKSNDDCTDGVGGNGAREAEAGEGQRVKSQDSRSGKREKMRLGETREKPETRPETRKAKHRGS